MKIKKLNETREDDYRIADDALQRFRAQKRFSNPAEYKKKYVGVSDDEYKSMKKNSLPSDATEEERAAYYNYIDNSSDITSTIVDIAEKNGLTISGLEARIKEGDSYLRKARNRKSPIIEDCVRFSVICSNQNLVDIYKLVTKKVKESGYSVHLIENNFTDDKIALNNLAVYYSRNGSLTEVWFHTSETFEALHKGHKYYEVLRSYDGNDPEEVNAILRVLYDIYDTPMPDNIESVKSTGTYLHEGEEEDEIVGQFDLTATLKAIEKAWKAV